MSGDTNPRPWGTVGTGAGDYTNVTDIHGVSVCVAVSKELAEFIAVCCNRASLPQPQRGIPFASEAAEAAFQEAIKQGIIITRDQFRPIIQMFSIKMQYPEDSFVQRGDVARSGRN
jgi:hypothetical protein